MAKSAEPKIHFFCSACGHEAPRWFGRCPACGAWNTAAEAPETASAKGGRRTARARWAPAAGTTPRTPRPLRDVELGAQTRHASGIRELDRVLGGGMAPGSLVLVGGDPGIGKSTLMLQLAIALASEGRRVLYVSGEESEPQIRERAERLGALPEGLLLLCETELQSVLDAAAETAPAAMVVDSIQTL